jgi:AAA+ ATPase superfamily predicted ATPase
MATNRKEWSEMAFFGRTSEKRKLLDAYQGDDQRVVLVYGRRRVGKSELIKQSLKGIGTRVLYYECKQTSEMNNVESLAALISDAFAYPKPSFAHMEEVLTFLFRKARQEKMILVLDEYPYVRNVVVGLDSILQSLIDSEKDASHMKLVLCGSSIEVMKSLLDVENPLYGRVDVTINLKAMDYYDAALFYPTFSEEDKVRLYSVFGGIPYYNRLIDPARSVTENIINLATAPDARLENEVGMYLRSEISKITNANEVFETLAKGFSKFSDILSQSHVSSGPTLVDVLEKLMRLEIVAKEAPINDEENKKKTGYFICDNFVLFFYRYVFRFASQIHVMDPLTFFHRFVEEDFETIYVPSRFERICKQYLIRQNREGKLEEPFEKIGKYYYDDPKNHRNGEFDVVTLDRNGYIFYEAKFRKKPIGGDAIHQEIEQVQATGLQVYRYGFFARSGFLDVHDPDLITIDLKNMYR